MRITKKLLIYSTDKFGFEITHGYGNYYDALFEPMESKELMIAEVGVMHGGSVRILHDYFVNSIIHGIDNVDNWAGADISDYPRLSLHIMDAYNPANWRTLPKFDIIIDDGSHTLADQIHVLRHFPNYLKKGGKLIIEDIPRENLQKILDSCNKDVLVYDFNKNVFDDMIIEYTHDT
jgi:trans-aconitate methyltransferase